MFIRMMVTIMLLIPSDHKVKVNTPEPVVETKHYYIHKEAIVIDNLPLNEIMAAIAWHEAGNNSELERRLIMEAFYNRVVDNYNNNGKLVSQQLLAPKQFTGLWLYNNPQKFEYDENNPTILENLRMADEIISGCSSMSRRIYYWAGTCDFTTKHGKWVKRNCLKLPKYVKHLFR